MEPYDPDAKDADGDGIVQERTPWERPVGARLLDKFGNEIQQGAIQNARPDGMQVIDKDGNKIDYVPSYAGRVPYNPSAGPKSPLSDHGALSLRERGAPDIMELIGMANAQLERQMRLLMLRGSSSASEKSDDTIIDELVDEIGDDAVTGNRTDDVGLRRLRKFLGTATEKLREAYPDASSDDVRDLLKHAALAYMWREEIGNREDKFNFKNLLDEIFDGEEGYVEPHDLLDALYEAGGLRLVSTAVMGLQKEKLDDAAFAKLAKRLQERFDGFELTAGDLDDGTATWGDAGRIGAIEKVLGAWDATKETVGDPDSLDDINDILVRKFKNLDTLSAEEIERILERPDIDERVNWDLLNGSVLMPYGNGRIIHYPLAEEHLHDKNGDIEDVPPEALITAMVDGRVRLPNGFFVDFRDVLFDPDLYSQIDELENISNARFNFQLIKNDSGGYEAPIWAVFQVTDKKTGKTYFLKASQYGVHDAMLERIGDDTQALFGFVTPTGQRFVTVMEPSDLLTIDSGVNALVDPKQIRWSLTPHVADVVQPRTTPEKILEVSFIQDVLQDAGISADEIVQDPELIEQVARLTVMDYLLANSDRHGGNLLVYVDSRGKVRLVPIDHGLLFGGRLTENGIDPDNDWDEVQWQEYAEEEGNRTPYGWRVDGNFSKMWRIFGDIRFRQTLDADENLPIQQSAAAVANPAPDSARPPWGLANERRMIEVALETVQKFDDETISRLFSPERLAEQGVELSDSEMQHLAAMETMFRLRLEQVLDDPDSLFLLFPR